MPNAPLAALVDAFTAPTLNTALWTQLPAGWALDTAHQWVTVPVPTSSGAVNAFGTSSPSGVFDATGSSVSARVGVALRGLGNVGTRMRIRLDANNAVTMRLEQGVFKMTMQIGGTLTTTTLPAYDPIQHAWWRLRESGGVFYADASADGFAWTSLASMAYSWNATAITFQFETAALAAESSGNSAYFAHVNTPLGGSTFMPTWPQIQFQVVFNQGGNLSGSPLWTDLSWRLRRSWSAQLSGRQYELDQVQSGQLALTLWNLDGALDPLNTASPYSPNVLPMRPCRLQAVWPPSRNLLTRSLTPAGVSQSVADGTAPASSWYTGNGTIAPATGLAPAPTGHTTATGLAVPATTGANNYPILVGATGGGAEPASTPVTAGQTYTASMWLSRSSGGDTTLGIQPFLLWYNQAGTQIGSAAGTAVTIPVLSSWIQGSATGTAPAGAVWCRLAWWLTNTSTTATNTIYFTAMQLEQASSASPWTAPGATYPLWAGFIERWPAQWDFSGTYGLIDVTAVDALASLAQFTLQPNFAAQLLGLGPAFMYPFTDAAGATSFADATGHQPNRIVYTPSVGNGGGSITAGNSVQGAGSVGSSGPVITVTNPNAANGGASKPGVLIGAQGGTGFPPTSGGWTRVICFRTTVVPTTGNSMCLWASTGPGAWSLGGSKAWTGIFIDPNQHVYGIVTDPTNTYQASITVPDIASCDGNWHIVVVQLSADGKTWTVACDNHGYQSVLSSGSYTPTGLNADTIACEGSPYPNEWFSYFQGDLAYATQFNYPIGNANALDLGLGFSSGWAGETTAARAQRLLNMAGFSASLVTEGTNTKSGGANVAGQDCMSALNVIGDSEAGQVWADATGAIRLDGRLWRYLQNTPQLTFGENQASGEVPYLTDAAVDYDNTHIYNDVSITNQPVPGAPQPVPSRAVNTASQQAYLPRTLQRTINVQDSTIPASQAAYLASQYGQPLARVAALNVNPSANPALWQTLLPLCFGVRANVNRRPPAGPGAAVLSLQQFIEHVSWSGDNTGNFRLALQLSPAQPFTNWGVVASLHTTVATASTSGTATVTLAPLTGSANNPASAVLSPGTVLTLGYGTANAENLTVQSVAVTSPGYTSVAVTFTAATTHSHAVGETVCQPLPSGYTLPGYVQGAYPAALDAGATLSSTGPRAAY